MITKHNDSSANYSARNIPSIADFYAPDTGLVTDQICGSKHGWIRYEGTRWRSVCPQDLVLLPSQRVKIIGRIRTSILVVEPLGPVLTQQPQPHEPDIESPEISHLQGQSILR